MQVEQLVAFLMKINMKKVHFKNVLFLFFFSRCQKLYKMERTHDRRSVRKRDGRVMFSCPLTEISYFCTILISLIGSMFFFRLNAVLCDIFVALIFICRPVRRL